MNTDDPDGNHEKKMGRTTFSKTYVCDWDIILEKIWKGLKNDRKNKICDVGSVDVFTPTHLPLDVPSGTDFDDGCDCGSGGGRRGGD